MEEAPVSKFPKDASKQKVIRTLEKLGFKLIREQEHIGMIRENEDGTRTPLTMPNHRRIKSSTLRTICTQAGISRREFLQAFADS
jgi:predicted RNA binding protein YcfA (HicA-like mRNA interferase family)